MDNEFDIDNMTPDDCVRLVDMMNGIIMNEMTKAAEESSILELDRLAVMEKMMNAADMGFDDIMKFCEIGEYIMLDRETYGLSEEEADRWKYKREAVIAMIDSLIAQATALGIVDEDTVDKDPTVEMLEEIWKLS